MRRHSLQSTPSRLVMKHSVRAAGHLYRVKKQMKPRSLMCHACMYEKFVIGTRRPPSSFVALTRSKLEMSYGFTLR